MTGPSAGLYNPGNKFGVPGKEFGVIFIQTHHPELPTPNYYFVSILKASSYLALVLSIISAGNSGAGGFLFQWMDSR